MRCSKIIHLIACLLVMVVMTGCTGCTSLPSSVVSETPIPPTIDSVPAPLTAFSTSSPLPTSSPTPSLSTSSPQTKTTGQPPAVSVTLTVKADGTTTYKYGSTTISGYLFKPNGNGPFPAVLMSHGAAGFSKAIIDKAHALGTQGYVVLAPHFLTAIGIKATGDASIALDVDTWLNKGKDMLQVLDKGLDALKSLPYVDPDRLGVIGYSTGGFMSLVLGTRSDVKADVVYYGCVGESRANGVMPYPQLATS